MAIPQLSRSIERALERIIGAVVELADILVTKPVLIDFNESPKQKRRRKLLDCELDGICGTLETTVFNPGRNFAVGGWKQFSGGLVIKFVHGDLQKRKAAARKPGPPAIEKLL